MPSIGFASGVMTMSPPTAVANDSMHWFGAYVSVKPSVWKMLRGATRAVVGRRERVVEVEELDRGVAAVAAGAVEHLIGRDRRDALRGRALGRAVLDERHPVAAGTVLVDGDRPAGRRRRAAGH